MRIQFYDSSQLVSCNHQKRIFKTKIHQKTRCQREVVICAYFLKYKFLSMCRYFKWMCKRYLSFVSCFYNKQKSNCNKTTQYVPYTSFTHHYLIIIFNLQKFTIGTLAHSSPCVFFKNFQKQKYVGF